MWVWEVGIGKKKLNKLVFRKIVFKIIVYGEELKV